MFGRYMSREEKDIGRCHARIAREEVSITAVVLSGPPGGGGRTETCVAGGDTLKGEERVPPTFAMI